MMGTEVVGESIQLPQHRSDSKSGAGREGIGVKRHAAKMCPAKYLLPEGPASARTDAGIVPVVRKIDCSPGTEALPDQLGVLVDVPVRSMLGSWWPPIFVTRPLVCCPPLTLPLPLLVIVEGTTIEIARIGPQAGVLVVVLAAVVSPWPRMSAGPSLVLAGCTQASMVMVPPKLSRPGLEMPCSEST